MGAPVATRTTSTWRAGTWSGVSTISDFPFPRVVLALHQWTGMWSDAHHPTHDWPDGCHQHGHLWLPKRAHLAECFAAHWRAPPDCRHRGCSWRHRAQTDRGWLQHWCLGDPSLQLLAPTGLDFCPRTGWTALGSRTSVHLKKCNWTGPHLAFPWSCCTLSDGWCGKPFCKAFYHDGRLVHSHIQSEDVVIPGLKLTLNGLQRLCLLIGLYMLMLTNNGRNGLLHLRPVFKGTFQLTQAGPPEGQTTNDTP